MPDWKNTTAGSDMVSDPPTSTRAGVLRPERLAEHASLQTYPCDGDLRRWVEYCWSLVWDLPDGTVYESHTLPHPACTLSVERGCTRDGVGDDPVVVTGVVTRRFEVTVAGQGWVVAAKFRPGGLAALSGHGVGGLRNKVTAAAGMLPASLVSELARLDESMALEECVQGVQDALGRLPAPEDARYDELLRIIAHTLADRSIVRVAQLEQRHGLSIRSLQRLFGHYVGVSPKWVLARYRMHDAVSDIDGGYDGSLADLAASLGWYDQAHFSRDFVSLVGMAPGRYRARRSATRGTTARIASAKE